MVRKRLTKKEKEDLREKKQRDYFLWNIRFMEQQLRDYKEWVYKQLGIKKIDPKQTKLELGE